MSGSDDEPCCDLSWPLAHLCRSSISEWAEHELEPNCLRNHPGRTAQRRADPHGVVPCAMGGPQGDNRFTGKIPKVTVEMK
jgi:hypothetical protein